MVYHDPSGLANEPLTEDQINTIKNTIVKNWDNNQFVDENGVRWFDQNIFDNVLNIGEGVNNLGCNLTSYINTLSQEYTTQTGNSINQEQLVNLFVAEYNASNVDPYGNVNNSKGENFLNKGNEVLELKGEWSQNKQSKVTPEKVEGIFKNTMDVSIIREYVHIKRTSPLGGFHFVNGTVPVVEGGWRSNFYDPYYGIENRVVKNSDEIIKIRFRIKIY